jgi:hypothetical protein
MIYNVPFALHHPMHNKPSQHWDTNWIKAFFELSISVENNMW